MKTLGKQLLVDLYDCAPALLDDVGYIETSMKKAATAAGAAIVSSSFHPFSPCGVSGVVAIRESHLAIHTWPEFGFAAVDLFTCGDGVDPWRAYAVLKQAFRASRGTTVEMHRGKPDMKAGTGATQTPR